MDDFSNPWQTLSRREIYENAWISVRENQVVRPDGNAGIYGVVSMKNRAVGVVPLHADGTVTLVGQWLREDANGLGRMSRSISKSAMRRFNCLTSASRSLPAPTNACSGVACLSN